MSRYYDDELYHFGRKGMKWGEHIFRRDPEKKAAREVRKGVEQLSRTALVKKQISEEPFAHIMQPPML